MPKQFLWVLHCIYCIISLGQLSWLDLTWQPITRASTDHSGSPLQMTINCRIMGKSNTRKTNAGSIYINETSVKLKCLNREREEEQQDNPNAEKRKPCQFFIKMFVIWCEYCVGWLVIVPNGINGWQLLANRCLSWQSYYID